MSLPPDLLEGIALALWQREKAIMEPPVWVEPGTEVYIPYEAVDLVSRGSTSDLAHALHMIAESYKDLQSRYMALFAATPLQHLYMPIQTKEPEHE